MLSLITQVLGPFYHRIDFQNILNPRKKKTHTELNGRTNESEYKEVRNSHSIYGNDWWIGIIKCENQK